MEDTSKKFCSILFDILLEKGVKDIVCSPGSRNVPLLLAAAARAELKKHFVVDERSAAFLGMGIALVSKNPVALVCTSGTALLNYAPAIAEAYYQGIPLIVISADRPLQWIDQDDSQTLRQNEALANYVKKSYSIPASGEDESEIQWFVNRIANDALITATSGRKGPVHINIHLSEPLNKVEPKIESKPRLIDIIEADSIGNKETIKKLALRLAESKVMVVAGFHQPDSELQKSMAEFCRMPNVAVMAETISNLHLGSNDASVDYTLSAFDQDSLDAYAPDIVISVGGALVSRKLKEFFRRNIDKTTHWAVGYNHTTSDPFMSLALRLEVNPARFFRNIGAALRRLHIHPEVVQYKSIWEKLRNEAGVVKIPFLRNVEWSELKAFDFILKNLPPNCNLFLSNGTPVRYAQLLPYKLPHASYCNRGVSGIDGSTSTAIGGALAFKGETLLITGDLSMAYDIGALTTKDIPDRFKIIVIDNQGGGIFRFIPSTSSLEICEEYLCQPPLLPLRQLSEGYGWDYFEADNDSSLKEVYPDFLSSTHKSILKISCPGPLSASILKSFLNLRSH